MLPLLHLVQAEEGFVSPDGIEFCAEVLDVTTAEVAAVATFYTMYKRRPNGDYTVGVCTNTLCAIMGGDEIFATLKDHLGVGHDETTDDGKVTLEHLECNAACDYAPVMMVNWEFFDNQTPESATQLVDDLRAGREVRPTRGARCAPSRRCPGCSPASPTGSPTTARRPARPLCSASSCTARRCPRAGGARTEKPRPKKTATKKADRRATGDEAAPAAQRRRRPGSRPPSPTRPTRRDRPRRREGGSR